MATDHEGAAHGVICDDEAMAENIVIALRNKAAQIGDPYVSGASDLRSVTLDGKFDLVVVARLLREEMYAELRKIAKLMDGPSVAQ